MEDSTQNEFSFFRFLPHMLILLFGWKMTVGPGVLFFHHLKYVQVFRKPLLSASDISTAKIDNAESYTLNAHQIVNIPFVQDFFFELSLPCLWIVYIVLYYCIYSTFITPDIPLIGLSMILLFSSCLRLIKVKNYRFPCSPLVIALQSSSVPLMLKYFSNNMIDSLPIRLFYVLVMYSFFQGYALSITPINSSMSYYQYSNPNIEILSFDGFHSTLRQLYTRFTSFVFLLWHYMDPIIVVMFFFIYRLNNNEVCVNYLILVNFTNLLVSLVAIKKLIQIELIGHLIPVFTVSKEKEKPKLKTLLNPLGARVFSLFALPVSQMLYSLALFQSKLATKGRDWRITFFTMVLLNGHIISSVKIVLFYFHSYIQQ